MNEMLPVIRCTGYPLSYAEAISWYRTLYGGRKKWPIFGVLAMGIIAFEAWLALIFNSRTLGVRSAIGLFFLFLCTITALVFLFKLMKIVKVRQLRPYTAYAGDHERHRFGTDLVLYTDFIEVRSLRGTISMKFSDVRACVEAEKGFALTDGKQWIILRAADMTTELALRIRERFFITIERKRIHRVSYVYPQLIYPLPPINVPPMSAPLTTATVESVSDHGEKQRLLPLFAAFSASLGGVAGVMIGSMVTLTPWPIVDAILPPLGFAAVMWLVALAATTFYFQKPSKALPLVRFYAEGISVTADDVTRFYSKNIITVTVVDRGVYMKVLNQQTLFVPFDAADEPETMKRLLGVAENGK